MVITVEMVLWAAWGYFYPRSFGWVHLIILNLYVLYEIGLTIYGVSNGYEIFPALSLEATVIMVPVTILLSLALYILFTKWLLKMIRRPNQEASSSS